jgi:hypothetical protein
MRVWLISGRVVFDKPLNASDGVRNNAADVPCTVGLKVTSLSSLRPAICLGKAKSIGFKRYIVLLTLSYV